MMIAADIQPAPAAVGARLESVDTPALLIDLDAFEYNLHAFDATLAGLPVRVRPHAKVHKCPEIALRQIARGAAGVCCQTVSEAEVLVRSGVRDIVVVNEVVGAPKIARLVHLARAARVGVCVDDPGNVDDLAHAARAADVSLDVLVEVNVGGNRCGVEPGRAVLDLARQVASSTNLRFAGLQAYHGRAQHVRGFDERRAAIEAAVAHVRSTLDLLEANGLHAGTVTGAGTGTYEFEGASRIYTEIQPGSYVFMDSDYGRNLDRDGAPVRTFAQSLFILTTVMSHAYPTRAVVDAGLKAHSVDSGMPLVHDVSGARYTRASDEHGVVELDGPGRVRVGQKIRLVPGHCDPTVNLYDWFVCFRGDRVEAIWPIAARGAYQWTAFRAEVAKVETSFHGPPWKLS